MRYHLGLVTPNDDGCHIVVDGQPYSWRDGEGVIFDETFIHTAENRTDVERLILFCDVDRPMRYGFARSFNHWFGRHVVAAASSPNDAGDRTGLINRLFFLSDRAGQLRRRFKAWNRTVYKLTKAGLAVGLVAALVLPGSVRTIHHVHRRPRRRRPRADDRGRPAGADRSIDAAHAGRAERGRHHAAGRSAARAIRYDPARALLHRPPRRSVP